jgi:hypothetical protein
VLVLKDRLIFMKTGGQFADVGKASIAGAALGGMLGGLIGSAIDGKMQKSESVRADDKLSRYNAMMEEQILRANKANFVLKFEDITGISAKKAGFGFAYGPRSGVLKIEVLGGKPQQYDISKKSRYEEAVALLKKVMPGRVEG